MRVTLSLHSKNPEEQALMRQLSSVAGLQITHRSTFPFNLLELTLRAGLNGLEKLLHHILMAAERRFFG